MPGDEQRLQNQRKETAGGRGPGDQEALLFLRASIGAVPRAHGVLVGLWKLRPGSSLPTGLTLVILELEVSIEDGRVETPRSSGGAGWRSPPLTSPG